MVFTIATFYLFMKAAFLYSLVRTQVKFDVMQERWLFLSILYTSGVAFLSYAFLFSWINASWPPFQVNLAKMAGVSPFVLWVGETFALSALYFKLLSRADDGMVFYLLLLAGLGLVWF